MANESANLSVSSTQAHWWDLPWKNICKLFLLGFSSGLPILLIFSTLSLWLREAGVEKSAVTYFSWAALGYSFKFVWAPIVDQLPLPILSKVLGRRRGWLLLSQIAVIASIFWMGTVDPQQGLLFMAFAAVALGFSSATQDVVIDTYRIEIGGVEQQTILSSTYVAGYRIGMIVASAGGLKLAYYLGSTKDSYSLLAWQNTYFVMAGVMLIGLITTLCISEPEGSKSRSYPYETNDYLRFFAVFLVSVFALIVVFRIFPSIDTGLEGYAQKLASFGLGTLKMFAAIGSGILVAFLCTNFGMANKAMVHESYISPITDFFARYGKLAIWVLLLVGFYRVSDIVLGIIANVFYQDLGYTKNEIADISKIFGVLMTILGSFIGGFMALRWGVIRILLLGAILSAATNLIFMWLASVDPTQSVLVSGFVSVVNVISHIGFLSIGEINHAQGALILVIAVDNLAAGLATAAFIAWLSSLTSMSFTATQYAIFSSVMTLFPKLLGGYSGTMVDSIGYQQFFLFTTILGIPIVFLILYLNKNISSLQLVLALVVILLLMLIWLFALTALGFGSLWGL